MYLYSCTIQTGLKTHYNTIECEKEGLVLQKIFFSFHIHRSDKNVKFKLRSFVVTKCDDVSVFTCFFSFSFCMIFPRFLVVSTIFCWFNTIFFLFYVRSTRKRHYSWIYIFFQRGKMNVCSYRRKKNASSLSRKNAFKMNDALNGVQTRAKITEMI